MQILAKPTFEGVCTRSLTPAPKFDVTHYITVQLQHLKLCHGCDENSNYYALSGTRTHISGIPGKCATITPCRLPAVTTIPTPVCVAQCRLLHSRPPGIVSLLILTITYIPALALQQPYSMRSLYRILVTATSVMGVMKMGNIVPRAGLEPTSLAFRVSVLQFHHVGYQIAPCYLFLQAYA